MAAARPITGWHPQARNSRMSRCGRLLAALSWLAIGAATAPQAVGEPSASLKTRLGAAVSNLPHKKARAGVCVIDLETGRTVFSSAADEPLVPASTMKLFTMAAAIDVLGPSFEFKTTLGYDGRNLLLIGGGDPSFADVPLYEEQGLDADRPFQAFVDALKKRDITTVHGDLVVDVSAFEEVTFHPDWEDADRGKWYAAPVTALSINDNCLDITLNPGKGGARPSVTIRPPASPDIIDNRATSNKNKALLHFDPKSQQYVITGGCTKTWPFAPVAYHDPPALFASTFIHALSQAGITVEGKVVSEVRRPAESPVELTVVAQHRTALQDLLPRIGKNSQNLFAEAVFKQIGATAAHRAGRLEPGSWSNGALAVKGFVQSAGIDVTGLEVSDGSGLSRENHCTARQLCELLSLMHREPRFAPAIDSLSVAGVDGSLRKRLRTDSGRVIGKTGTMRRVRALAGYVLDEAGSRRFAFATMFNNYSGPSSPYRAIQDKICLALMEACDDAAD